MRSGPGGRPGGRVAGRDVPADGASPGLRVGPHAGARVFGEREHVSQRVGKRRNRQHGHARRDATHDSQNGPFRCSHHPQRLDERNS